MGLDYEHIDTATMTTLFECAKVFVCEATNAQVAATFQLNGKEMKARKNNRTPYDFGGVELPNHRLSVQSIIKVIAL